VSILDEAIGLHRNGRFGKKPIRPFRSLQPLCKCLFDPLLTLLAGNAGFMPNIFVSFPNLSPLDPENFQQARGRRARQLQRNLQPYLSQPAFTIPAQKSRPLMGTRRESETRLFAMPRKELERPILPATRGANGTCSTPRTTTSQPAYANRLSWLKCFPSLALP